MPSQRLAPRPYDALGRMITNIAGGTRTDTFFNGRQDIQTRTAMTSTDNGSLAATNIFSTEYVNALLARDSGGSRRYFTHDANFNITGVVGTNGSMLQRQAFDAYGKVEFKDASFNATTDGYSLTHLWQGGLKDAANGMYLFQARWYSTTLQTWVSVDPIQDGFNWYEAMADNPISRTDAWGLFSSNVHSEITYEAANGLGIDPDYWDFGEHTGYGE